MQAGWYPDPMGDHEFRYHNGNAWTGDVATDGERQVTPVPDLSAPTRPHRSNAQSGTVAMVFGVISMTIGWIPFVCFVAICFGLSAIAVGLRRRRTEAARSAATVGIVTGVVGILLSSIGIWLSVVIIRSVAEFEDPGPHEVELTSCAEADGVTRVAGEITNLDDRERSYTITVSLDEDSIVDAVASDVPAGETRTFSADENLRFPDLACAIDDVKGPRPFGLEN